MINFETVDPNARASNVYIEMRGVKRSVGGTLLPQTGLIVGQYDQALVAGIVDFVPVQVFTADEVGQKAGFGSEAHRQALWTFGILGGFSDKMWWAPVPEPAGAAAATEDIVFTGTATKSGTAYFSIGGDFYALPVVKDDTPTIIGDNLVALIASNLNSLVSGVNTLGTVAVTAKTKGANGNDIRIVFNPAGTDENNNPEGVAVAVPGTGGFLVSGVGVVDTHDVFFNSSEEDILGDRFYTQISAPYNDAVNIGVYSDSWDARFDPSVKRFFNANFAYTKESYAAAFAIPATINKEGISPSWDSRHYSPQWEVQAAIMGLILLSATFDPGRPFKTLSTGLPYDFNVSDLSVKKNDALFKAGMGYMKSVSNSMVLGDLATSFRTNATAGATEKWFDTVSTSRRQQKLYDVENLFKGSPYDRAMVADDDSTSTKAYVIKPKKVIADFSALVDLWVLQGWTKNGADVKASIKAEINTSNNSRIDTEVTDDEALPLRVVGVLYKYFY